MFSVTDSVKRLALTASSVVLSLGVMGVTSAQASEQDNLVYWDLEFIDNLGEQVGDGEFAYDLGTTDTIYEDIAPISPELLPSFDVKSVLERLSINVIDKTFGSSVYTAWWLDKDSGRNPGQQFIDGRYSLVNISENSWTFPQGDFISATDILFMDDMEQSSDDLWIGNWSFTGFDASNEYISAGGTWSATLRSHPIPEPTTTFGLLAFSAFGVASKLKRKHQ